MSYTGTSEIQQPQDTGTLGRFGRGTVRFARRDPVLAGSLAFLVLTIVIAVMAPILAPHDPAAINPTATLAGASSEHLLGTDHNGRDVLSRLIYGARISVLVGFLAVSVAIVTGVPVGLVSGYVGGFVDQVLMRAMDCILAFPTILLALTVIAALGTGVVQLMIAIGISSVPLYARLVRSQVLYLRSTDFVQAARASGAGSSRILLRHIFPNCTAPLIVQASLGMGIAILAEAALSFLGVGVEPPTPTWGEMLQTAVPRIQVSPALAVYPGLCIFFVVLALNLAGDSLRDRWDPRLRHR